MGMDVRVDPVRPGYDDRVGVGHPVLRYVQALVVLIAQLRVQLRFRELEHAHELTKRDRIISDKDAQIADLERQLRLLRESGRLSSRNSSRPPSSDPPQASKRAPKTATGKRRGGQPGHPKRERALVEACTAAREGREPPSLVD